MNKRAFVAFLLASVMAVAALAVYLVGAEDRGALPTFRDYGELSWYLDRGGAGTWGTASFPAERFGDIALGSAESGGSDSFSRTNVQVEGVDEMDIVKTDGTYVFVANWEAVYILQAVPPEGMAVVSTIPAESAVPSSGDYDAVGIDGIFLDAGRLIVIAWGQQWPDDPGTMPPDPERGMWIWYPVVTDTFVTVFDFAPPLQSTAQFSFGVSGRAVAARLTGGHVYVVAEQMVQKVNESWDLPRLCNDLGCEDIAADTIRHDPASWDSGFYTTVLTVDIRGAQADVMSAVTGYGSTVYMSHSALYLSFQKWEDRSRFLEWSDPVMRTTIYKVNAEGLDLEVVARGEVPGMLLNQFSMDEHNGYLRVATTSGWSNPTNDVYVLDADLRVYGALTGLAPTERIFAARFVGDTLYLVTFRQIDPFFVIDLSNPAAPRVAGELKIPGFSSYLHLVGEGLVIGLGQQDGQLKASLFDVTDPENPSEVDTFLIDGYTYSPALQDHKAVLVDETRDLFAFPVQGWTWDGNDTTTYSGTYVLAYGPGGLQLRGIVDQGDDSYVMRSLYIGDVLYTVSNLSIKGSSLPDLVPLGFLTFGA